MCEIRLHERNRTQPTDAPGLDLGPSWGAPLWREGTGVYCVRNEARMERAEGTLPEDATAAAIDRFERAGFRVCEWFPEPTVCFCEHGDPCPTHAVIARIPVRFVLPKGDGQ